MNNEAAPEYSTPEGFWVPQEMFVAIARRAVRSARACIETVCGSEPTSASGGGRAWDTGRRQASLTESELDRYDLADVKDAVRCLELLGLIRRPFPERPQVVEFWPEIDEYEPTPDIFTPFLNEALH